MSITSISKFSASTPIGIVTFLSVVAIIGCGGGQKSPVTSNDIISAQDDFFTAKRNEPTISPNVLLNDVTQQQSTIGLHVTSFTSPHLGFVSYNQEGTFTYQANSLKNAGEDSFSYTVSDVDGNSKSATVHVSLLAGWDSFQSQVSPQKTHFSFSNGDLLVFQSSQNVVTTQTYHQDKGWDPPNTLLTDIVEGVSWQAIQAPDTERVYFVGMKSVPNTLGHLVMREYSPATGWVSNVTPIATAIPYRVSFQTTDPRVKLVLAKNRLLASWTTRKSATDTSANIVDLEQIQASYYSIDVPNTSWSSATSIDDAPNANWPASVVEDFFVDSSGSVIALMYKTGYDTSVSDSIRDRGPFLYSVNLLAFNSAAWVGAQVITEQTTTNVPLRNRQFQFDTAGHLTFAWMRGYNFTTNRIQWDVNSPKFVSSPVLLDAKAPYFSTPFLSHSQSHSEQLFWVRSTDGSIYFSSYNIDGTLSTPQALDAPRATNDKLSEILGAANIIGDGTVAFWKKDYPTNPSYATPQGTKIFASLIQNGNPASSAPVTVLDTVAKTIPDNPSGFVRLIADANGMTILLTVRASSLNASEYSLFAQDFSNWDGTTALPPSVQISTSTSVNSPRFLTYTTDNNNHLTLFWNQDDGSFSHIFASRLTWDNMTLTRADTIQLDDPNDWMYTGSPYDDLIARSDNNGNTVVAWNLHRDGVRNVIARTMYNGQWDDHAAHLINLPFDGQLTNTNISELFFGPGNYPTISFQVEGFGLNGSYITRFH